jgi:fatty acid desaturase
VNDVLRFDNVPVDDTPEALRQRAIRRIKEKYDFKIHLVVFLTINAMLIALWAFTGNVLGLAPGMPLPFFWPAFPLIGWGIGLVIHGYTAYFSAAYSEAQIQREMHRLSR